MSNSNINLQTQSSNALHNAIMEAGSKDRPPMLAPDNYVQWKSRIKRYINTKPNSELIHYCLQNPPYTYQWAEKTVPVAEGSSETTTERYMENYKNVSQDIRDQLNAEAEAVQIILTGIDNDIYSTVDACPNACEMWKAIERLKQGESINVQDLETNLYWEFGKFTSRDGESLESYYSRFYKMMNELVRNQCHVTNHQVNVQFLLQLQPEWQRFVTLVKAKDKELKTVSYHKLNDILSNTEERQEIKRAERLARTANPLALVAQQQPVYHPQNHPTQNTQYSSTISQQSTKNRGKAIVTSSAPTYDPEPATVTEDEEMLKEKEIDKLMALISLSFKKIYKPTNNNLQTSSNTSRANQDNSPRINRGTRYDNQRAVNVAGARENLNEEQADWKDDTDDESDDQELEAHYMYMAHIQELLNEIDRLSREYYYADDMNAILGVYTDLDKVTNLQCDYLETMEKVNILCKEKIKNDKSFKEIKSNVFLKEREQYFKIQDLKAQLQDKGIAINCCLKNVMQFSRRQYDLHQECIKSNLPTTSVSKKQPQLKSNQMEDKSMPNNIQGIEARKKRPRRILSISNIIKHLNYVNDRTRQPMAVPISTREPKHNVNQSVATSSKKTVATDSTHDEIIYSSLTSGCSKPVTFSFSCNISHFQVYISCSSSDFDSIRQSLLGTDEWVSDGGRPPTSHRIRIHGLSHAASTPPALSTCPT
ncbi:hypothetical protein Tco_1367703 [Tanacetum coccineum]